MATFQSIVIHSRRRRRRHRRPGAFGKLATIADPDGNYVQLVQCDVDPFDE